MPTRLRRLRFLREKWVCKPAQSAPYLIAIGLLMLLAAASFPAIPVATAMAVIALGATLATIARTDGTAVFVVVLATHLVVYASMYALFVGAVWHAATAGQRGGLSTVQAGDLVLSAAVMLLVVRLSFAALTRPTT